MAEQDINIIIRMKDELTSQLNKATENIHQFGYEIDQAGRHTQQLGMKLAMVGTLITGSYIAAIKSAEDISIPAYEAMQNFDTTLRSLQVTIVEAALPALRQITGFIQGLVNAFNNMDPVIRNAIIQWTFIGGAVLLATGIFLKVVGALTSVIGRIIEFASNLNPVSIAILAIVTATILFITYWQQIRDFVMPIIAGLQIAADMVAIGWEKAALACAHFLAFAASAAGNVKLATYFESEAIKVENTIAGLEQNMANAMSNTGATWANNVDGMMGTAQAFIQNLVSTFQNGFTQISGNMTVFQMNFETTFNQAYKNAVNIGQQSAKILVDQVNMFGQKFGESFAAMIMHGKNFGESIKQMCLDMAEAFIAAVARMIAEWMAFIALKAAFSFLGFHSGGVVMHSGGPVRKAHSGMSINSDEVPILAQTGEGIISRTGMRTLGGPDVLAALNAGKSINRSVLINIEINNPSVRSDYDIDDLTNEISRRIAREADRIR